MKRLELAAELRRLLGCEPVVNVVQQLDVIAQPRPQGLEQSRHRASVRRRFPDPRGAGIGMEGHAVAGAIRPVEVARGADLSADRTIAELTQAVGIFDGRFDVVARGVAVAQHALAAEAAEQ